MGYCAVVDCDQLGMNVVTIPTSWGAWEHWICDPHQARVDDGAVLDHDPAYRVTLQPPPQATPRRDQLAIPEQARGTADVRVRPLRPRGPDSRRAG